jgi:hypothetical protein
MFAAMVFAVRHALDYRSSWRALAVCGLAFALVGVLAFVIGVIFAPTVA